MKLLCIAMLALGTQGDWPVTCVDDPANQRTVCYCSTCPEFQDMEGKVLTDSAEPAPGGDWAERAAREIFNSGVLCADISCTNDDIEEIMEIILRHAPSTPSSWISVLERLPKMNQQVLVWFANSPGGAYMDAWKYDGTNQYFRGKPSTCPAQDVTHWMPLPEAPKPAEVTR